MSQLGVYQPGGSVLHRARPGLKLTALVAVGGLVVALPGWVSVTVALGLVLAAYAGAGLPMRSAWKQCRPLLPILVALGVFQTLSVGAGRAAEIVLTLLTLVLLAGLVTLTTRTTAMVDALVVAVGPLRRFGVDPDRVGLSLALGIRAVPLVVSLAQQVREAQLARGLGLSPTAFAVPLIVRALRRSDAMAEALVARGALDDDIDASTSTRG
ncbi:energy-coupling factor transporter transmembrane protein EcfT [Nocardioidaceae bacterium]|nr:energy-coupling factor transporter transmembrane protein EcfT [Nocardioidaceae bacterium]